MHLLLLQPPHPGPSCPAAASPAGWRLLRHQLEQQQQQQQHSCCWSLLHCCYVTSRCCLNVLLVKAMQGRAAK
jgi:hypothetical protein